MVRDTRERDMSETLRLIQLDIWLEASRLTFEPWNPKAARKMGDDYLYHWDRDLMSPLARRVLDAMEAAPLVQVGPNTYQSNPLPRYGVPRTPDQQNAIQRAVRDRDWTIKPIPTDKLVSRQTWIRGDDLVRMTATPPGEQSEEPTAFATDDGTFCIVDGNHRAALALLSGQPTLRVRLLNLDNEQ